MPTAQECYKFYCSGTRRTIESSSQSAADYHKIPKKYSQYRYYRLNIPKAIYNRLISDYDFLNEIWDGNKGPEDLSNEFSDFFKISKRGYFLNDFDDSMKNHMIDSPLPSLTGLSPIENMPVKKDVDER